MVNSVVLCANLGLTQPDTECFGSSCLYCYMELHMGKCGEPMRRWCAGDSARTTYWLPGTEPRLNTPASLHTTNESLKTSQKSHGLDAGEKWGGRRSLMHDARQMLSHALRRPRTDTHLCIGEAIQVNAVAHVSKSQIIIYMQTIIRVP